MKGKLLLSLLLLSVAMNAVEYAKLNNLRYREDSFYEGKEVNKTCVLDLHYPKEQQGFRTIIWFHGGGLTGGKKYIIEELKGNDQAPNAFVTVGYRLAGKDGVMAVDCLDDAAAAVAWVLKNIERYGGNPAKVFVTGHSAGGYLTMMVGMAPKWLEKYGCSYQQLCGLIPLSGQCLTHFRVRAERHISSKQPLIDDMAPLFYATTPSLPPILLVTGDRELEMLGRMEENALMYRMLKINGHQDVKHLELQGYGHGMEKPAYPLVLNFVNRVAPVPKNDSRDKR